MLKFSQINISRVDRYTKCEIYSSFIGVCASFDDISFVNIKQEMAKMSRPKGASKPHHFFFIIYLFVFQWELCSACGDLTTRQKTFWFRNFSLFSLEQRMRWQNERTKSNNKTVHFKKGKGTFIVYCICVAVSCSGRISVSTRTTALQYYKEMNLRCSALRWAGVDN